jgi:hypothetical protein
LLAVPVVAVAISVVKELGSRATATADLEGPSDGGGADDSKS